MGVVQQAASKKTVAYTLSAVMAIEVLPAVCLEIEYKAS